MKNNPKLLGGQTVSMFGLGCMNLSHGYGKHVDDATAKRVIDAALEAGYRHFDTAALYGFGHNECLLAPLLAKHRQAIYLASKCGIYKDRAGKRYIDGRPESIIQSCHDSLQRLKTDYLDLFYLHRIDDNVPIEESVQAMAWLIARGDIKGYGLSEMSAQTVRSAHAVCPLTAVQSEYSLWTRNPEIKVLATCAELDIAFVAFSPLARAFLADAVNIDTLSADDIRRTMPRFSPANYPGNYALLLEMKGLAQQYGRSLIALALGWIMTKARTFNVAMHPIPGSSNAAHVKENAQADGVLLSPEEMIALEACFDRRRICGDRYNATSQQEVTTEIFA